MISRRSLIRGSKALITSALLLPRKSRAWTHGGSGGGGYIAKAVHFAENTSSLGLASLDTADSPLLTVSGWYKTAGGTAAETINWLIDAVNFGTFGNFGKARPTFGAGTASNSAGDIFISGGQDLDGVFALGQWFLYQVSWDTNHPSGQKLWQAAVNGVVLFNGNIAIDPYPAFDIGFNSKQIAIPDIDGDGAWPMDVADLWIAPGQFVDLSVPANIAKFISGGKPVYLGANGELPTGTSPAIFGSGDADTFLRPNLGTGGSPFILTGPLTNASSSPSG